MNKKQFHVVVYGRKDKKLYEDVFMSKSSQTAITNVLMNKFKTDEHVSKIICVELQPINPPTF